jgi:hypothetical protein
MNTDTSDYLPTQEANGQSGHKEKAFQIIRAEDSRTGVIIQTRQNALEDSDLPFGARVMFAWLLDLSLSWYTHRADGVVVVSATKISERLKCSTRVVYNWTKKLVLKRYVWLSEQRMPNMWPVNTYHITALDAPDQARQMPTKDGLWGNGVRRERPQAGEGARAYPCTKQHASPPNETPVLLENATASRTNMHASAAQNSTPEPHKTTPGSRTKQHVGAAFNAAGSGTKEHLAPAQTDSGPPNKTAVNRESKDGSSETLRPLLNVQRCNALKKGGENGFLLRVIDTLVIWNPKWAKREMSQSGAWWRSIYRKDADKAERVRSEIGRMIKEKVQFTDNPGAAAVDLWKRFA